MNDVWTVRAVTMLLGVIAISGVLGGVLLASSDRQLPEALVAVCSGAAGALGALLARTSSRDDRPT